MYPWEMIYLPFLTENTYINKKCEITNKNLKSPVIGIEAPVNDT